MANKKTNNPKNHYENLETMQEYINELEKSLNTADEVYNTFVGGFIVNEVSNVRSLKSSTLQNWFSNIDDYLGEIKALLTYYYIANPDIFQLYSLMTSIPSLDYKIIAYKRNKSYDNDIATLRRVFEKEVDYRNLTRNLIIQLIHEGTLVASILGNSKAPYVHIYDDLDYCFPYGKYRGKMRAVIDLEMLDKMKDVERESMYDNLKPLVTKSKFEKWKNETDSEKKKEYKYIILKEESTLVARCNVLYNNQRFGVPFGTQGLMDILHKEKMKSLEQSIADRVMKSINILKFKGIDENGNKVSDANKTKVFNAVKNALNKSVKSDNGLSVIALPDFADMKPAEIGDLEKSLSPEKYQSVNSDIASSTISKVLASGEGSSYSSSQLNLDMIYNKLKVVLEQIEPLFDKLITFVLGENKGNNYKFVFDKRPALTKKDAIGILGTLQSQGYSIKYIIDELGLDFNDYINQSKHEIEDLELRKVIVPPQSTYTTSGKDKAGSPETDDVTNENTDISKASGGNGNPKPSTN